MHPSLSPLLLLLAPTALLIVAAAPFGNPGQRARWTSRAVMLGVVTGALGALSIVANGPMSSPVLGGPWLGLSTRLDVLSVTMSLLVAFVGAVVVRFSASYLDGDPGQGRFMRWLGCTLASVLLLVSSGHLALLALTWTATSLCLHRLLVFYDERPRARLAARKKFLISRLGDLCLCAALALCGVTTGTLEVEALSGIARSYAVSGGHVPMGLQAAGLLLVCAALLKSAQFPFHGWLTEVMETPTPVSALLHAGVINAGGFLVLRTSDIVVLSAPALAALTIVGGFTAVFASLVMRTQPSVKVALAWSTAAQMGFMMLQCGLGVFSAALVHIVAHSLYKAHAFLSAGSAVAAKQSAELPERPSFALVLTSGLTMASMAVAVALAAGLSARAHPGEMALVVILALGLSQSAAQRLGAGLPVARVVGETLILTCVYGFVQLAAFWLLAPTTRHPDSFDAVLAALAVATFAANTLVTAKPPAPGRLRAILERGQVHLANGLYINGYTNRLLRNHA